MIDDNPIQSLDINWLRNNITLVQQESVLFNETIGKNIAFGRGCNHGGVERWEIESCIDMTMLRQAVDDMPAGIHTIVGGGGDLLSGGQKQRVVIARSRLRDTPILILDESTSALDHSSRTAVMDAIRKWRKGKTTIIITHDMSQIDASDYVYILENGCITHEGYRSTLEKTGEGSAQTFIQPKVNLGKGFRESSLGSLVSTSGTLSDCVPKTKVRPASVYLPSILTRADQRQSQGQRFQGIMSPFSPLPLSSVPEPQVRPLADTFLKQSLTDDNSTLSPQSTPTNFNPSQEFGEEIRLEQIGSLESSGKPKFEYVSSSTDEPRTPTSTSGSTIYRESRPLLQQTTSRQKNFQNSPSLYQILGTVFPTLTWKTRILLVVGFICAFLHASATPIFSFFFSKLLTTFFLTEHHSQMVLKWTLSILGVSVGDGIASFLMHYLLEYCGQAWVDSLRREAMVRILDQPRDWFEREKNQVSNLTSCLDRNAEEMRNLVGRFAGFIFVAITTMAIAIIWSLALCWKLTMVGLACAPVLYAITRGFETTSGRWEKRCNDSGEALASISAETFTYIKTVRALTLESDFHKKHQTAISEAMRQGLKRSAYSGVFFGLSESAILFVTGESLSSHPFPV
jgi:ATP-binding cassette subfamily B (MDR/TAP) protein 1